MRPGILCIVYCLFILDIKFMKVWAVNSNKKKCCFYFDIMVENQIKIKYDPGRLWRCKHTFLFWPHCPNQATRASILGPSVTTHTGSLDNELINKLLDTRRAFSSAALCVRVTQFCSSENRAELPSAAIATNCSISWVQMLHLLSLQTLKTFVWTQSGR